MNCTTKIDRPDLMLAFLLQEIVALRPIAPEFFDQARTESWSQLFAIDLYSLCPLFKGSFCIEPKT